jgi:hypothetical protein
MRKIFKFLTPALVAALAACGGGGGSPGETNESYTISLRAEKTVLPLNVGGYPAGIGVYAPFTTTLYVSAQKGDAPIPGGEDVFTCNTAYGLGSGPLYYLDGDDEHEDESGNPIAYRSIKLGANSGGNSFHFHAGDQAGIATIVCSVVDPRSSTPVTKSINITVGSATGQAASIKTISQYDYLGTQGNQNNIRTTSAIQAFVLDDANQPLPTSANANLQVSLVGGGAIAGARLLGGQATSSSSSSRWLKTTGGVATFSLSSGASEGTILVQMVADRSDNDVTNGIQDPIAQLLAVAVTSGTPAGVEPDPLVLVDASPPAGTNGLPYSYAFSVTGGVAPYTWTALGSLPEGLILSPAGILSGTPNVRLPSSFNISVRVTDSRGTITTKNLALAIAAAPTTGDPATTPLSIVLDGCGADVNTACSLRLGNPTLPVPEPAPQFFYQYVLSLAGPGTGTAGEWTLAQAPSWLTLSANGILSITTDDATATPELQNCTSGAFFINATRAGVTTMRKVQMVFGTGAGICKP